MTYVPIVPVIPPQPSPRARELGRRLKQTIDDYRREDPNVSWTEIRQAMTVATPGDGAPPQAIIVAVVLGLGFAALGVFLFLGPPGMTGFGPIAIMAIVGAAIVAIGLAVLLLRRR